MLWILNYMKLLLTQIFFYNKSRLDFRQTENSALPQ